MAEPPGAHCPQGGTALLSGLDVNGNGTLEDGEVSSTAYACNGNPAQSSFQVLVRMDAEPAGSHCAQGGSKVSSGLDANGNGILDSGEETTTAYVCHGASGSAGAQALVRLEPEPAGSHCFQGGTAVHSGLDTNGNGTLDTPEVAQTQYVCSSQSLYRTRWSASPTSSLGAGEVPGGFWAPTGLKTTLLKTSSASRLKITVSDGLGIGLGANPGSSYHEVRMNGGTLSPRCLQGAYVSNANTWANDYRFPFATVCLTNTLPAGLYEFETWVYSGLGKVSIGTSVNQPLLFVEELPADSSYGFSRSGELFDITSTAFQQASGRALTYTKQASNTLLKVTLSDTLRAGGNQNFGYGTVMVRLDGVDTSCFTSHYESQGVTASFHWPFVMTCLLPGIAAGPHTFNVWLRSDSGGSATLGYEHYYPLLLVEEISSQNLTYSNTSNVSAELSGEWAGVGTRQVQHTVSAPGKTLRVTYSDTFRAAYNCNARWGFYQLYVDNQPTWCINGQYASNAGGAGQNHHRSVNQVCLVENLPPGPHTFSIWSSTRYTSDNTTCGSNQFGWSRGQNLLMVEELP